jgi:hypothetical protein
VEQISSVVNECKNLISLSIYFACGGEIMERQTGLTVQPSGSKDHISVHV